MTIIPQNTTRGTAINAAGKKPQKPKRRRGKQKSSHVHVRMQRGHDWVCYKVITLLVPFAKLGVQ